MKMKHLVFGAVGSVAVIMLVVWIMGQFSTTAGLVRTVFNPTKA